MKTTELRNQNTMNFDKMSTAEMVAVMQAENENAVKAVGKASDKIAQAIDAVSEKMKNGGRLLYIGCGTSGRLGVLDASECPPTFGVSKDKVVGIIAGGDRALRTSVERTEDDEKAGREDLSAHDITAQDVLVGISVAGDAAYVMGAVSLAKEVGALTVGVTSNFDSRLARETDIPIVTDTGAEVVAGSTRLKAGTAHKMVINMLSTCVMAKQGYVYENMMINLKPLNVKLTGRMIRIVCDITGVTPDVAERSLEENDWNIRNAVEKIKG
ncbi:MAG: N-acetylmuramic acid 6-phosphate etherase [Clostridia bacterium]|nr:N-acetylmuramic acid 6-phosphate etherase [Clostridia bacterium]